MNRVFGITISAVLLAACSQAREETQSTPMYFVGQTLSPNVPAYLFAGANGPTLCRLSGRDAETRVLFLFYDQILVEVTKVGTSPPRGGFPSGTTKKGIRIRECEPGQIGLIHPVDRPLFHKAGKLV
jgi:hypothetical protein